MDRTCCTEVTKVTKIKVEEHGKKAVFLNPKKEKYEKIRVDGCLIKNKSACDFWVINKDKSILIELKGCDVSHALVQIEETFTYLKRENLITQKIAALIVCHRPGSHPAFNSKVQRFKEKMSKQYKAPLHIIASNKEYVMDNLISFI